MAQLEIYKTNKAVYTATYWQCLIYIGVMSLTDNDHLKAWMTANNARIK